MVETTLCAADACNSAALKGDYCLTHLKEKALAWHDINREGEKRRKEHKCGTIDFLIEIESTKNEIAAQFRNVARYNVAFDECVEIYRTIRYSPTTKWTQNIDMLGEGGSPESRSKRKVQASKADYLCDFDLAVGRVLNAELLRLLQIVVEEQPSESKINRIPYLRRSLHALKQRLGRALVSRGVWPTHQYFKPRYITVFAG
jgi:hypothetical protein